MERRINAIQAVLGFFVFGMVVYAAFWLLSPVHPSHTPARRTLCLTQLKQMGLYTVMYAGDYDGKFPDATQWIDQTLPYARSSDIYRCPLLKKPDFGYAFNVALSKKVPPAGKEWTTVSIFESTDLTRNAHGSLSLFDPARHVSASGSGSGSYVVYADGHAKYIVTGTKP